jgi:hypothetical protein
VGHGQAAQRPAPCELCCFFAGILFLLTTTFQLFDRATDIFLQSKTPLIADAINALESIEQDLTFAHNSPPAGTFNIICVAATAGVLVAQKYITLLDDCKVYAIAIGKRIHIFLHRI